MNGLRIAIIAVLLVLAVALAAQAAPLRTLVVAPDGDDAADGVTRPWRTLDPIVFRADAGVVAESNEGNNCRAAAATVKVTR